MPSGLSEYAFRMYILFHLLRRESACQWVGWLSTHSVGVGWGVAVVKIPRGREEESIQGIHPEGGRSKKIQVWAIFEFPVTF